MAEKILSISVASYNLGEMIEDNLRSFCDSGVIDDIEVLVINDESTDDTAERAERFAKKYPNSIKVITQKNAGPGATVNNGIKHATGKYFRMVDGDDWVNPKDFAKLIKKLKELDVDAVFCNYTPFHQRKQKFLPTVGVDNMKPNVIFNFEDYEYHWNPPLRMHHSIFRTEIMKEHVKLDNGFYTDTEYMFYPTPYIKKAIYLDLDIYQYRVGMPGQSTSPEKMRKNRINHRKILDKTLDFYEKVSGDLAPKVKYYLARQTAGLIINHLDILLLIHDKTMTKDIKDLYKEIEEKHPEIYKVLRQDIKSKIVVGSKYILAQPFSLYLRERYKHI